VVYCQQPPGFVDEARPDHVGRLHKSLYGLKQPPPPSVVSTVCYSSRDARICCFCHGYLAVCASVRS
jgi:hypothetical protein